ncbi:MAG: class I SAM-dependent methyltransferase [Candidatus Aminicenantes bacterium]|nr:class I SAM-dependent methyltransferase [Candidatus Aminicenantes bacterium]
MNPYLCPKCHDRLQLKPAAWRCAGCGNEYGRIEGYYDFYLPDSVPPETEYPPALAHLLFSEAKILALPEATTHRIADRIFRRRAFNARWTSDLRELKETIRKYGASERRRVEFMVDDRAAADFVRQKQATAWKAKNILRHVSSLPHTGNKVLHVGCGGECNEAIPEEYQKAGFVNFGVDAVRSYVEEFSAHGEAQLANASALPYADETFDVVNFTDILEHLFDPIAGMREAARVLKKNGHLVLETPNRAYLRRRSPLSWLEYFLGRLRPGLLRPRVITAQWAGEVLFHTEFSRRELALLLKHAGMTPLKFTTEILKKSDAESPGEKRRRWLVSGLEKIAPTGKWIVIARKA